MELPMINNISFVITSVGTRDNFIDDYLLPSIVSQAVPDYDIIIVGKYNGRCRDKVTYIPVSDNRPYFYKPFQQGVEKSKSEWIVDLDDDMVLSPDWYQRLSESANYADGYEVYGFMALKPNGSVYVGLCNAFEKPTAEIVETSYFCSYIARRKIFDLFPYPTYMSGDRDHGVTLGKAGCRRKYLPEVKIYHYGADNVIPRAEPGKYERTLKLRKRLGFIAPLRRKRINIPMPVQYNRILKKIMLQYNPEFERGMANWFHYAKKLEERKKNIGIVGWFGHRNVGDDLILHNMLQMLDKHDVNVFADIPEAVDAKNVYHYGQLNKYLDDMDLVLFGGGGILHDKSCVKYFPQKMNLSATPVIVYAGGIPFSDWCSDIKYFLDKCYLVTVRDSVCLDFLRLKYPYIQSMLLPDPAFMTPRADVERVPGKVILNIREIPAGWGNGLPRNTNSLLSDNLRKLYQYLQDNGYQPHVLGFEPRDSSMLSTTGCPFTIVSVTEAIKEIASAELVISTRLHAGIIAATQNTPLIMIDYQQKIRGLQTMLPGLRLVDIKRLDLIREFNNFRSLIPIIHDYSTEIANIRKQICLFNNTYISRGG